MGSNDAAVRVIWGAPRFLSYKFENTVLPTVEFFKGLDVPLEQILTVFVGYPRSFLYKLEALKKTAELAS